MPDLTDADPVEVAVQWLAAHPAVLDALGGPEHVTGIPEAPWPHVVVSEGVNGVIRESWHSGEFEVELAVLGHPTGAPGQAALWRIAMKVLKALSELPEQQVPEPGVPVVSIARPSGVFAWSPMTNGQPRYVIGVLLVLRAPTT